ncbi:hypothetical protein HYH03_016345 [Edaphochlamys debaryana]|uniref:Protein kinase domain-containing protein n=1 Tax=Edaphochlamys debaryana TaxID=47281 RepID=A0A835XK06_9CHLO|nr:hypothetical protein HYH03_016345 [Edaphochlamys debaryana]|eukprot:KAG2484859.1 hypothetical protein HYH03_016345 [Edaphochlamys debaryana]
MPRSWREPVVATVPELLILFAYALVCALATTQLKDSDWVTCPELPATLRRNVTVQGATGQSGPWPLISFNSIPRKLVLADHVTLELKWLSFDGFRRRDNFMSRPGLDLLMPSPPGTVGAMVVFNASVAVNKFCMPSGIMQQNFVPVVRPASIPGEQRWAVNVPQPGCVDASTAGANLTARCWSQVQRLDDLGMTGLEADASDNPQLNNYVIRLVDSLSVCRADLPQDCVDQLGPIGCLRLMQANPRPLPPLLPEEGDAAAAVARTRPAAVSLGPDDGAGISGGSSSGSGDTAIIVGCVVGGVAALALAAAAVGFAVWRRRRGGGGGGREGFVPRPSLSSSLDMEQGLGRVVGAKLGSKKVCEPEARPASETACKPPTAAPVPSTDACSSPAVLVVTDSTRGCGSTPASLKLLGSSEGLEGSSLDPASLDDCPAAAGPDLEAPAAVHLTGRVLGKGAWGRVLEGQYLGQRVAVKQFTCFGPMESAVAEQAMRACVQELEILARCNHPNVVRLLAACVTGPRPFTVMELCDVSLAQYLYDSRGGALLPMSLVLHVALEIAKGLEYLHPTIVHRDLKPGNVLLINPDSPLPEVKITDFGLSRVWDTVQMTNTPEAGTPPYLAPECFDVDNFALTHKVDIYSWGVCVWEMLAGERPWQQLSSAVAIATEVLLRDQRPPMQTAPSKLAACGIKDPWDRWPPRLQRLLMSAWRKDPGRRPAAADLVKELALLQELEKRGLMCADNAAIERTANAECKLDAWREVMAASRLASADVTVDSELVEAGLEAGLEAVDRGGSTCAADAETEAGARVLY